MRFILMLLPLLFTFSSYAFDAGLTATQAQEKVQNQAGSEDGDPISYGLVIGHVFDSPRSTKFSPKLGYIKNEVNSPAISEETMKTARSRCYKYEID